MKLETESKILVFATNNANKVSEIRAAAGEGFNIITLQEAGITIDIPEPHETLEANAFEKARTIYTITGHSCFGEDTGLFVDALNGEPGVQSARYAGESRDFDSNVSKLLRVLRHTEFRSARFRTVIALVLENREFEFEGVCEGHITKERRGAGGFGYDPVFIPKGSDRSFGEMTLEEKNHFSHRKKALEKLLIFLATKQ